MEQRQGRRAKVVAISTILLLLPWAPAAAVASTLDVSAEAEPADVVTEDLDCPHGIYACLHDMANGYVDHANGQVDTVRDRARALLAGGSQNCAVKDLVCVYAEAVADGDEFQIGDLTCSGEYRLRDTRPPPEIADCQACANLPVELPDFNRSLSEVVSTADRIADNTTAPRASPLGEPSADVVGEQEPITTAIVAGISAVAGLITIAETAWKVLSSGDPYVYDYSYRCTADVVVGVRGTGLTLREVGLKVPGKLRSGQAFEQETSPFTPYVEGMMHPDEKDNVTVVACTYPRTTQTLDSCSRTVVLEIDLPETTVRGAKERPVSAKGCEPEDVVITAFNRPAYAIPKDPELTADLTATTVFPTNPAECSAETTVTWRVG